MSSDALNACCQLAQSQGGVISRTQALGCGTSPDVIDRLLRSRQWQKLHRGVYSVSAGKPGREMLLWAAVSRAGAGAALSHETAAELFELADERCSLIHVSVPGNRRVSPIKGVVVHISSRIGEATHPSLLPPRTRLEETLLDLVDQAATFDTALGIACSACQRGLTTVPKIGASMAKRAKLRWRPELAKALRDIGAGVHSVLEYRYLHKVERSHGLPEAVRQARITPGGRSRYLDNLYEDYGLCVELDGLQAHPDEQRWQDLRRINAITQSGKTVLRYGWIDVDRHSCKTAVQVAVVMRRLGWQGSPRACGPACVLARRTRPVSS
jgi:very-short-patch-repair endonuclease